MSAASAIGAPPAHVRNGQVVLLDGVYAGATAHVYLQCPQIKSPPPRRLRVTAVQAWVVFRVTWCRACRQYGARS